MSRESRPSARATLNSSVFLATRVKPPTNFVLSSHCSGDKRQPLIYAPRAVCRRGFSPAYLDVFVAQERLNNNDGRAAWSEAGAIRRGLCVPSRLRRIIEAPRRRRRQQLVHGERLPPSSLGACRAPIWPARRAREARGLKSARVRAFHANQARAGFACSDCVTVSEPDTARSLL